jgi:hypothetical protein
MRDCRAHLNTEPEHAEDGTADNAKVSQIVTEAPSDNNGEGDVQSGTDRSVDCYRYSYDQVAEEHDRNRFPPREPYG